MRWVVGGGGGGSEGVGRSDENSSHYVSQCTAAAARLVHVGR